MMYIVQVRGYTGRRISAVKYQIRSDEGFAPSYEFDTYEQATEFIRYIYGGNITETVRQVFEYQNARDKNDIGGMVL